MARSRSLNFRSSNITARIPLQSWKSLLAISMTASPRGKRFRASRWAGRENPPMQKTEKQQAQLQITTSLRARKGVAIFRPHTNLRGRFGNGANEFTNMHYYPNRRINSQKRVEKSKKTGYNEQCISYGPGSCHLCAGCYRLAVDHSWHIRSQMQSFAL